MEMTELQPTASNPLEDIKFFWEIFQQDANANIVLFFQKLFATEPGSVRLFRNTANSTPPLSKRANIVEKHLDHCIQRATSIEDLVPGCQSLCACLCQQGFEWKAFLDILGKTLSSLFETLCRNEWTPTIKLKWHNLWRVLQHRMLFSGENVSMEVGESYNIPKYLYQGSAILTRLGRDAQNHSDGIVDTNSRVRLSIFSGQHGVVVLRAVDALDVTVFEQDIGPTSPDVNVEENFSVLLRDPDNGVWGIQFESAKALSGFLSGISIAQDIVFSNKSERQTKSNGCLQGSSSAINFWARAIAEIGDCHPRQGLGQGKTHVLEDHEACLSPRAESSMLLRVLEDMFTAKRSESEEMALLRSQIDRLEKSLSSLSVVRQDSRSSESNAPTPPKHQVVRHLSLEDIDVEKLNKPLGLERMSSADNIGSLVSFNLDSSQENSPMLSPMKSAMSDVDLNRPFPYTNAVYIQQQDIYEDGIPPIPRAIAAQRHMEVMVLVREATNLPVSKAETEKSYYCVEITCDQETFKTDVRIANSSHGCQWFERSSINVPAHLLQEARRAMSESSAAPSLLLTLYDCGRYSGREVVGSSTFTLDKIFDIPDDGILCNFELDKEGSPVFGENGKESMVSVAFRTHLSKYLNEWQPPSLEDTLRSSESKVVLAPARVSWYSRIEREVSPSSPSNKTAIRGYMSQFGRTMSLTGMHDNRSRQEDSMEERPLLTLEWDQVSDMEEDEWEKIDYYWRERLEKIMDSLLVNILIICLVCVDICNIIVYTFVIIPPPGSPEPVTQVILSSVVVFSLLIELTLRQIAMGVRFWKVKINIFDFSVVWLSAIVIIMRKVADVVDGNHFQGVQAVVFLRIFSRIAVILRVARVLINLRRARQLSGHVAKKLRSTVSQNKRRYKKHGFDLDLTYITSRVIAMGTPAFGKHSSYRNDIHVVSRFMSLRHYGCFFIFNLCDTFVSSDGVTGNYNPNMLFNQVQRIPFEDHGPPLMSEMLQFCEEAQVWLQKDPRNVIAIHCKGGKGRSGVMSSAIILWSGHRKCAVDALELFTFRRTENYNPELGLDGTYNNFYTRRPCNQTVEGPSQIRYVHYLEAVLYSGIDPLEYYKMLLMDLEISVSMHQQKTLYISYTIKCCRSPIFDSANCDGDQVFELSGSQEGIRTWPVNVMIWGDVRIEFYKHKSKSKSSPRKLAFFCVFNTSFYKGKTFVEFQKSKVDMLNKDRRHRLVGEDFCLRCNLSATPEKNELMELESDFRDIFMQYGVRKTFSKGDTIIEENTRRRMLYLIVSGSVEGVVNDITDGTNVHPLGRSAAEAISFGKTIGDDCTRVPNVYMLGPGWVIGASPFLSAANTMLFRARTSVIVYGVKHRQQEATSSGASVEDVVLEGVPADRLSTFYKGLSVALGTQLSRIRIESIRIGNLKAFNDRQTVMAEQDESEKLRSACIKEFGLPMNEKLVTRLKCSCRSGKDETARRMRLLVLLNYLVLDPEFYGPTISPRSELWSVRQMHSVAPAEDSNNKSIILTCLGERVHGLDIVANLIEFRFTFRDSSQTRHMYHALSSMCKKAEEIRGRERVRPFETASMSQLLERCSRVHFLKKNDNLPEASTKSSLFLVRTGEIRLVTLEGNTFRVVREGSCFGEINFSLNCTAGHYKCVANVNSVVLEISHPQLHKYLKNQPQSLAAFFFLVFCQAIEKEIRETVEETFPGTWSKKFSMSADGTGTLGRASRAGKNHSKSKRGSLTSTPTSRTGLMSKVSGFLNGEGEKKHNFSRRRGEGATSHNGNGDSNHVLPQVTVI